MSYGRAWMTVDVHNRRGELQAAYQYRTDCRRTVIRIHPGGAPVERVTWRNFGSRGWDLDTECYEPHQMFPWADGHEYEMCAEWPFEDLDFNSANIAHNVPGYIFFMMLVFQHVEFDFLRSSSHGGFEHLRRPGHSIVPPDDGIDYHLGFPPLFANAHVERRHMRTTFVGLSAVGEDACAVVETRNGARRSGWETAVSEGESERTETRGWQSGQFVIRLRDRRLVWADLTENAFMCVRTRSEPEGIRLYVRGNHILREATRSEYEGGLSDWPLDRERRPTSIVHVTSWKSSRLPEALVRSYDLVPSVSVGANERHRFKLSRYWLDDGGNDLRRVQYRGDAERTVDRVEAGGRVHRIRWRNVGTREDDGVPRCIAAADGLEYELWPDAEDVAIPSEQVARACRQGECFGVWDLVSAQAELDLLRSRTVGIDRLRRIGDRVFVPSRGRRSTAAHRGRGCTFHRGELTLTFLAINDDPCAVVDLVQGAQPFHWERPIDGDCMEIANGMSWLGGRLEIAIATGELRKATLVERWRLCAIPEGRDIGPNALTVIEVEPVSAAAVEAGLADWDLRDFLVPPGSLYDR